MSEFNPLGGVALADTPDTTTTAPEAPVTPVTAAPATDTVDDFTVAHVAPVAAKRTGGGTGRAKSALRLAIESLPVFDPANPESINTNQPAKARNRITGMVQRTAKAINEGKAPEDQVKFRVTLGTAPGSPEGTEPTLWISRKS